MSAWAAYYFTKSELTSRLQRHHSVSRISLRYVEYLTPSPYIEEIITEPFKVDAEGYLPIPDRPGLGIELNREALKRFGV